MKTLALILAFAVAFICGMCLEKHRTMLDQYQVEYQADVTESNQK